MMRYLLLGLLLATTAHAEWEPDVQVGVGVGAYSGDAGTTEVFRIAVGDPVYIMASYEKPEMKMVGQPLGEVDMLTFGMGVRKTWGDVSVFLEGGYTVVDASINDEIMHEAVWTEIVKTHDVGRPWGIPVDVRNYEAGYNIDNAISMRIGVGVEVMEHFEVAFGYKFIYAKEEYNIYDENAEWREDGTRNLGSAEITLIYKF